MKIDEMLMKALTSYDNNRARSQQVEIGVSQIGGCRTQVWLQLQDAERTNDTLKLPALMGTAIHKMIEEALSADWNEFEMEREVEYDGLKGHIDLYVPSIGAVVDWKTTKLKNLDYFPSKQQRWQVHLYAFLLSKNGETPKTVTLVGIPRDGDERHIRIHTENYDEQMAMDALLWLADVKERTESPAPERHAAQFCQHYCPYFGDVCMGKGKEVSTETITDEVVIGAVDKYIEISAEIKSLEDKKDGIKALLENVDGVTPSGVAVKWSQVAGRSSIDEQEVQKLLGYVPKKQGDPSMRLTVK
jgi:hypothetical protein